MFLILLALGNPGETYEKNRHNVGFIFADWMYRKTCNAERITPKWKYDKYADADTARLTLHDTRITSEILLAKPKTFMNRSGFTANKLLTNNNQPPTTLFVIHDDLDIKLGEFKIQQGKGPKVHNGLSSVESSLRFKDFWRIRIGIDNRDSLRRIPGEPYVLQNFTPEEMTSLTDLFPIIFHKLRQVFEAQEQS